MTLEKYKIKKQPDDLKFDFFHNNKKFETNNEKLSQEKTSVPINEKIQLIVYIFILMTFYPLLTSAYYINLLMWVFVVDVFAFVFVIYKIRTLLKACGFLKSIF